MASATGAEAREFLTKLAAEERVSASTQKQALNALVFFLREVADKEPGDFSDFARARRRVRVPVVLNRAECQRLFEAMEGTPIDGGADVWQRGAADGVVAIAGQGRGFGTGPVGRAGGQGRSGPGDGAAGTGAGEVAGAPGTVAAVACEDRARGLAGVWLPEGLERKWPKAGESWEWQWFWPSREASVDPRSGLRRRHHVLDATFQHYVRQAARKARLDKKVTPHVLRHSFATQSLGK